MAISIFQTNLNTPLYLPFLAGFVRQDPITHVYNLRLKSFRLKFEEREVRPLKFPAALAFLFNLKSTIS